MTGTSTSTTVKPMYCLTLMLDLLLDRIGATPGKMLPLGERERYPSTG